MYSLDHELVSAVEVAVEWVVEDADAYDVDVVLGSETVVLVGDKIVVAVADVAVEWLIVEDAYFPDVAYYPLLGLFPIHLALGESWVHQQEMDRLHNLVHVVSEDLQPPCVSFHNVELDSAYYLLPHTHNH